MINESNMLVTFSKRRSGLFKKASELCTLCGVDVALVVASQNNDTMQFIEARRNTNMIELNAQLTQINNTLDDMKKHGDELSQLHQETKALFWWGCPIGGMNRVELESLKNALKELKNLVAQHVNGIAIQDAPTQTLPFFVGNASSSSIHLYMSNPQLAQMIPPQLPQNPMFVVVGSSSGLFKKASELCTLCGVDVALVVFSPSGKTFSYGHPNVDTIIDRYLSQVPSQNTLDDVKKHGDELRHLHKEIKALFCWACPIGGMNRVELEFLKKPLKELKFLVAQHVIGIAIQDVPSQTLPFLVGNASSSDIPLYMSNPQQAQTFLPQLPQNPMLQSCNLICLATTI
ncbi:hypothetical protein TSUD_416590 [Trifolium subterraneum]|uniref:MADS-box domain-containing protein n=1 Tax=Trifolium subterraneum TaxID=3900 RepID=A0A2Z6P660_TRISU|nr:hypothetical protein TSUD_416590 [Trifolium subterraneum]